MSLSKLEKDALAQDELVAAQLRELAKQRTVDERKRERKVVEDDREHLRFCVKALEDNIWRVRLQHLQQPGWDGGCAGGGDA